MVSDSGVAKGSRVEGYSVTLRALILAPSGFCNALGSHRLEAEPHRLNETPTVIIIIIVVVVIVIV